MADASVTPNTVGGFQTLQIVFFPLPVITAQDGGRIVSSSWAGSGTSVPVDSVFTSDGASTGITGQWNVAFFAEQQKVYPYNVEFVKDYAEGSAEPFPGVDFSFVADSPAPVYGIPIGNQAFFDNTWNFGQAGPEQSAVRNSASWVAISNQPAAGIIDTTGVKTYPANQINLASPTPVSSFKQIRAYADAVSPDSGATPNVRYEAAWDIYGYAHTAVGGITLEMMFWTYNHGQDPHIGSTAPVETGIDLNGDGVPWDLYMTPDTAATGGITGNYSYGIWYMQDAYQQRVEQVWVDILAGLRYFLQYYVVASGPGAPSDPLDIPLVQLTRGWEVCSTNYSPLPFRLNDYRMQMQ